MDRADHNIAQYGVLVAGSISDVPVAGCVLLISGSNIIL
jgi:hypothetical protein